VNGKHNITLYSLGINGAKIIRMSKYVPNYWTYYKIEDVIKRIMFMSFYERFHPNELLVTPRAFPAGIRINQKDMYVYVLRGSASEFMEYLKWTPHFN